jgi:predicted ester cyclase
MASEGNKKLVKQFIDQVMTNGNTDAIAGFCVAGSMFAGGITGQIKAMKSAFPDIRFSIDDMVAEGQKVAVRVTARGTNTGPLVGLPAFGRLEKPVPPTSRSVTHSAIYVFTLSGGKIVSYAAELDQVGLLRQLGWTFTPPR